MENPKISMDEFRRFCGRYYGGQYPGQRFGQAFLNLYFPSVQDDLIFYEEDDRKVKNIIFGRYVQIFA